MIKEDLMEPGSLTSFNFPPSNVEIPKEFKDLCEAEFQEFRMQLLHYCKRISEQDGRIEVLQKTIGLLEEKIRRYELLLDLPD